MIVSSEVADDYSRGSFSVALEVNPSLCFWKNGRAEVTSAILLLCSAASCLPPALLTVAETEDQDCVRITWVGGTALFCCSFFLGSEVRSKCTFCDPRFVLMRG